MKYFIVSIILICLLAGCTKELPFPDSENDDFIVMNGLINPESGANIHLSQSCHITDTECNKKYLENAQVFLKDESGNNLVELTHKSKGIYTVEEYQIEHNKIYKIEATSTGMESINAQTSIPKPFNCSLIDFDENLYQDYVCRVFEIEIEDNPEETNYYLIDGWIDILNGQHQDDWTTELNGYELPHTGFLTKDINAENNDMTSSIDIVSYPIEFIFLTDENFNGETYKLEFGLHDQDIVYEKNYKLEAHINVKSVSKELYDYYKSVSLYKLSAANFIAEPSQIFSNVEKGLGIFGGYSQQQLIVALPETEYWFSERFNIENDGCTGPCTVKFFANLGDKVNFAWDFGDGNTSTEKNPEHEYQSPGIYTVSLSITLGNGDFVGLSTEVEIK